MRKLLLVFLLILPTVLAQGEINPDIGFDVENAAPLGITNPKLVSFLDISFKESGTLDISPKGSKLRKLDLELHSFPREEYYIDISRLSTSPDALDNKEFLLFSWEDLPKGKVSYELNADLKLDFSIKKQKLFPPFPFSNIPPDLQIYLDPSEKINSDDPNIKRIANEIILGENDAYVVAYKLARFVTDEMVYDLDYLGRVESATNILRDKTGVCVEYANLFIALSRSVGIPARYVSGYAYGNVYGEKFNAHAWTEVYLPNIGWIPFDPTFGEYGWVDMTHIKTQHSEGPDSPSLRYEWIGGTVTTSEPLVDVDLNEKREDLPDYIINNLWVEKDIITPGSYNVVWMSLENTQDFYIAPEARLTSAPKILGKNQQTTILKPKGEDKIGWIIQIPEDLDPGFTYTYTINGATLFGTDETTKFVVDPRKGVDFSLFDAKFTLGIEELDEPPTGLEPMLNINLQYPELAYVEEEYNLMVSLYNSGNAPFERLNVCVEDVAKECESVFLGINDRQVLTFTQLPTESGSDKLFVTVSGEDVEESQIIEISIVEKDITTKIIDWFYGIFGIFFN